MLLSFFLIALSVPEPAPLLNGDSLDALAEPLRGFIAQALPKPLYEDNKDWGHTKRFPNGVKWKGHGLHVHPELKGKEKNDGAWRRLRITAQPQTVTLVLRNLKQVSPDTIAFDAFFTLLADLEYERQNWQAGIRIYSGSTRARFRIKLGLHCEATSCLEKNGTIIPDLVLRLRVVNADLHYDNLVFEHVAGLGGEAAKQIGKAVQGSLHRFHPSLERDLLAKADAAIVKAGDTKEIRLSLGKLLQSPK